MSVPGTYLVTLLQIREKKTRCLAGKCECGDVGDGHVVGQDTRLPRPEKEASKRKEWWAQDERLTDEIEQGANKAIPSQKPK